MFGDISGTLSFIISLINQAYISITAVIWYYVIYYGLNPTYSFPVGIASNEDFLSFYNALFNNVYIALAGLIMVAGSLYLVISNSLGKIQLPSSFLYRAIFSVTVSYFSFDISIMVLKLARIIFLQVWNYGNVDWYSLFSITGSVQQLRLSFSTNPYFEAMEFLFLSIFFSATGALLAVLEVRQALVIFLVLTLPLFSLFFTFRGMDRLAVKFWKLFVEINTLPFFVAVILYTIHIFPNDFLLQAGLLVLAATSPYLLVSASSILSFRGMSLMTPEGFRSSFAASPMQAASKISRFANHGSGAGISGSRVSEGRVNQKFGKGGDEMSGLSSYAFSRDMKYDRFDEVDDEE